MAFVNFLRRYLQPVVVVFILWMLTPSVLAQDSEDEIRLLARPMPDSILLRWAPTSYPLWLSGNKHGYMVNRTLILKNGEFVDNPVPELLTDSPLKPAPLEEWEETAEDNDYAGIAAQAIHGDGFEVDAGEENAGMLQIHNRATEQQSKFGFALLAADISPKVARLSGLWFTDRDVNPGEKYLYKVWQAHQPGDEVVDTAYYYTGTDEHRALPAPANVMAEPGDKSVSLKWERSLQEGIYTGYWIERSQDKESGFKRLNSSLLVNTTPEGYDEAAFHHYVDSLPDNQHDYFYRIVGVSPFGEEGPPSQVVEVKGEKKIKQAPRLVDTDASPEGVDLTWEMEDTGNVDGFRIFRSGQFKDNYEIIADSLPAMQDSYLDESPLSTGYYRLQAYNQDGGGPLGAPKMVQVIDSVPPAVPTGLKAEVDSTGHVFLEWKANSDADISGYRVFRANAQHEEFSQLTGSTVENNRYTDTINIETLTKKVYYKILAVDQSQNWSGFSEVLEVDRPDVVPPATPLITSVDGGDDGIELEWNRSPSTDVMTQLIYRNKEGNREWVLLDKLGAEPDAYRDSLAISETIYRYLVMAVDSAGNESKPGKAVAGKMNPTDLASVKNIEAKYDKNLEAGVLKWEYAHDGYTFLIYKKDKENPRLVHSTESMEYVDNFVSGNSNVSYSVVVKSPKGERSDFSEFLILNNKK
ncbi:MAG: hypothetical protein ACOC1E_00180 [Marinilabiliaceae bacterium]